MSQVISKLNKQPSLEWLCVNLKGEINGKKWLVSIKYQNLYFFKGLILLCQSVLETRTITHLYGSAHFTIPLTGLFFFTHNVFKQVVNGKSLEKC